MDFDTYIVRVDGKIDKISSGKANWDYTPFFKERNIGYIVLNPETLLFTGGNIFKTFTGRVACKKTYILNRKTGKLKRIADFPVFFRKFDYIPANGNNFYIYGTDESLRLRKNYIYKTELKKGI